MGFFRFILLANFVFVLDLAVFSSIYGVPLCFESTKKLLMGAKFSDENDPNIWTRIDNTVRASGKRPVARLSKVDADDVSEKTKEAMKELEENGGEGEYARIEFLELIEGNKSELVEEWEVVRITSPPSNQVFGSSFDEILKKMDEEGVPVVIYPNLKPLIRGAVYVSRPYSDRADAIYFLTNTSSNMTHRHELQHIFDEKIHTSEFKRKLPKLPDSIIKLLERTEAGEQLGTIENSRLRAASRLPIALREVRASEGTLKSLFHARGFKEIFLTPTLSEELMTYMDEIRNATRWNVKLLYYSLLVNPSDPRNVIVVAKFAVGGYLIYEIFGDSVVSIFYTDEY